MREHLKIELERNGGKLECTISYLTGEFTNYNSRDYMSDLNINNEYTPKIGDTFFFLPGVTIPRVKLKDIQAEYKIKTVREVDSANVVFIGAKSFDKIIDRTWQHSCDTNAFRAYIQGAYEAGHIEDYYYEKLKTALEFYAEDKIITEWPTNREIQDRNYPYFSEEVTRSSQRFDFVNESYADVFPKLSNCTLYTDASLMPYINGSDAVTIDATMFSTLSDMFSSSDRDNYVIAMEIMANSNYFESLVYLSLLFYEFGGRIEDQPTKNHINFKTLRNYMGFSRGYCTMSDDDCIKMMIDKDAVTIENMSVLLEEFKDNVLHYGKRTYMTVKEVSFSEEIDKLLGQELSTVMKEDYVQQVTQVVNEPANTDDFLF